MQVPGPGPASIARVALAEDPSERRRGELDPTVAVPLRGPVGLRFRDRPVELAFRADYQLKTLSGMRFALAAGIVMYAVFGGLDAIVIPAAALPAVRAVRFGVVVPLLCLGLALLYHRRVRRYSVRISAAMVLVAGGGLVVIVSATEDVSSLAYYSGFLLIDMFAYTVMQLPFLLATTIGWSLTAIYIAGAIVRGVDSDTLLWHGFFLASGNLAGMVGAWFIERLRRRDFAAQLVLARDRAKLVQLADDLERMAHHDPLTGLFNRRFLDTQLRQTLELHKRYGVEASLVLVDLDDFKDVNDTAGHPAGDALLAACAAGLRACTRATDMVFRYGGDEFLVLAPETGLDVAGAIGERIRRGFADLEVPGQPGRVDVSCSIGICAVRSEDAVPTDVLNAVDSALYAAKRAGKARVVVIDDRPA